MWDPFPGPWGRLQAGGARERGCAGGGAPRTSGGWVGWVVCAPPRGALGSYPGGWGGYTSPARGDARGRLLVQGLVQPFSPVPPLGAEDPPVPQGCGVGLRRGAPQAAGLQPCLPGGQIRPRQLP